MKVNLSGFRELEQALVELETLTGKTTTGRAVLRRTGIAAMKPLEARAKQLAPRDDGELADSITTKQAKARRRRGSVRFERSSGVEILTGPAPKGTITKANAGWQERGTVDMLANAYMRPAADAEGQGVVDKVREILTREIGKAAKRIANKAAKAK